MILLAGRASRGARRIIPAIAGVLSLLTASVGLAERMQAAELVGATAGELGVSAEGSANYSIEIAVPPGTTGVQPKLSLNYDSQAGNGALGVGFSLGGLSAISRCGKTLPIDSTISTVDYSANDRFCLDGQRLVPVSGSYGADGTGGKFVNGAVTAAFARMFNDEMHRIDITCGAAAGGAAAMCIGTAAAGVSCPATGATCAIAPSAAVACASGVTAAIAVCSIANSSGGGSIIRVHGNSAASMQGTEVYYLINNITGAIDKIGITSYPGTRYSQAYLDGEYVTYSPQAQYTWRYIAMVDEQLRLLNYQIEHGQLPRLNKILR
jgi:hypothetical protein